MKQWASVILLFLIISGCNTFTAPVEPTVTPTITTPPTQVFTPTPTSDPAVVLVDDFSDRDSGWWVTINSYGKLGYGDGKYHVTGYPGDYFVWSVYEDATLTDGVFSVDYKIISGNEENTGVIMCWRVRDLSTYYFLQISRNGYYSVGKVIDNEITEIVRPQKNPLLHIGSESNNITMAFAGDEVDIYFNRQYVRTVNDSSIKYGDIALGAIPSVESEVQAEFDNVALYRYDVLNSHTPIRPDPTATPVYRSLTWDGLVQFLIDDHTNWAEYNLESYNCMDYAIDLVANARSKDLKAWIVGVYFYNDDTGHAFVAFETSDRGTVYVEPQGDNTYSNVAIDTILCDDWGQFECYGTVEKIDFIDCDHERNCTEYIP